KYKNAIDLSVRHEKQLQDDEALYSHSTCLFRVVGFRSKSNFRLCVYLFRLKASLDAIINYVGKSSVLGATILFIFLRRNRWSLWIDRLGVRSDRLLFGSRCWYRHRVFTCT